MATDFATAPAPVPQPNYLQTMYGQGQYTPPHSGDATPANVSPTSPRTNPSHFSSLHQITRQLRPPKSPLYVPAVLRPTEKPQRSSPPKHGDSNISGGDGMMGPLGRHATSGSIDTAISRICSDEFLEEAVGGVTGPPTQNHWKPDSSANVCSSPNCNKTFGFFLRRHHCRRCGGIFCAEHSSHLIKLNQHALFHPDAALYRACDGCFLRYQRWLNRRDSQDTSEGSSQGSAAMAVNANPSPGASTGHGFQVGSMAGSVPRDWNWSTF